MTDQARTPMTEALRERLLEHAKWHDIHGAMRSAELLREAASALLAAEQREAALLKALRALVAETERCDRPGLYGVSSDDAVTIEARAVLAATAAPSTTKEG